MKRVGLQHRLSRSGVQIDRGIEVRLSTPGVGRQRRGAAGAVVQFSPTLVTREFEGTLVVPACRLRATKRTGTFRRANKCETCPFSDGRCIRCARVSLVRLNKMRGDHLGDVILVAP